MTRIPSLLLFALSALGWSAEPIEKYQPLVKSNTTLTIAPGEYTGTLSIPNVTHDFTLIQKGMLLRGKEIVGGKKYGDIPWISGPARLWNGNIVTHVNGRDRAEVNQLWVPDYQSSMLRFYPWPGTPKVYAANLTYNITIIGGKLQGDRSQETGLYAAQVRNLSVSDMEATGYAAHGLYLDQCADYRISGVSVWDMGTANVAGGGYGIGSTAGSFGLIENCKGRDIRYVVTLSGDYRTVVRGISGNNISASVCDLHGMQSMQCAFSKIVGINSYSAIKSGNESWGPDYMTSIDRSTITGRINIVPLDHLPAWVQAQN